MIQSYKDLEVHKKSYNLAMEIFWLTKEFPKDELYSLTSQVVRSSRSISSNITESWAKREYENLFKQHLIHALGSNAETENWLAFAHDCEYITESEFEQYQDELTSIIQLPTSVLFSLRLRTKTKQNHN